MQTGDTVNYTAVDGANLQQDLEGGADKIALNNATYDATDNHDTWRSPDSPSGTT